MSEPDVEKEVTLEVVKEPKELAALPVDRAEGQGWSILDESSKPEWKSVGCDVTSIFSFMTLELDCAPAHHPRTPVTQRGGLLAQLDREKRGYSY